MARYRLVTEWQIDAPLERVWDTMMLYRDWPSWWKGFRSVEQIDPGDEAGIGMRLRQRWRSLLPYTLTFDLEVARLERRRLLEGRASGDVEGTCTWRFDASDTGTRVTFVMDIRTARWWMNIPVPFAARVFALNFNAVMRWGSDGLARRLGPVDAHRTSQPAAATI